MQQDKPINVKLSVKGTPTKRLLTWVNTVCSKRWNYKNNDQNDKRSLISVQKMKKASPLTNKLVALLQFFFDSVSMV